MSEQGTRKRRVWPLRLVELSPLVALALLAALWLSLPPIVASSLPTMLRARDLPQSEGDISVPEQMRMMVDYANLMRAVSRQRIVGTTGSFTAAAEKTWWELAARQDEYISTATVEPLAFDGDDPVFDPVATWGSEHRARVWTWVVLSPQVPPLVAEATPVPRLADAFSQTAAQDLQARAAGANEGTTLDPTGENVTREHLLDVLFNGWEQYDVRAPLRASSMVSGSGEGSGSYDLLRYTREFGGRQYRYAVLSEPQLNAPSDTGGEIPVPDAALSLDPREPGYADKVSAVAKRLGIDVWVFGPVDYPAIPVRLPEGATVEQAEQLSALIWPSRRLGEGTFETDDLFRQTTAGEKEASGAEAISILDQGLDSGSEGPPPPTASGIPPQTLLFALTWDRYPGGPPTASDRAWLAWQRTAASNALWLFGAGLAFLGISLVAAPIAFVYERRRNARERAREEIARMRRDAHDRVYNRLSALSKQVSLAGDSASREINRSLSAVASDIRGTVGDLQEILGDEKRHTDAALTVQPIAEQLDSVCSAQAARLGIEVTCRVEVGLPDIPAALGWDLQCIAEEAITNAVRHGGAAHAEVTLVPVPSATASRILLTVTDDGSGSAVASPDDAAPESSGLRGMRDRAAKWGGDIRLEASPSGSRLAAEFEVPPAPEA